MKQRNDEKQNMHSDTNQNILIAVYRRHRIEINIWQWRPHVSCSWLSEGQRCSLQPLAQSHALKLREDSVDKALGSTKLNSTPPPTLIINLRRTGVFYNSMIVCSSERILLHSQAGKRRSTGWRVDLSAGYRHAIIKYSVDSVSDYVQHPRSAL